MKTTTLILSAMIATLPAAVNAANIQGNMYTSPREADNNHPAPSASVPAPYGRVNIDTDDQSHVATTAYVKGAYNSAIAAVNRLNEEKQEIIGVEDVFDGSFESVNTFAIGTGRIIQSLADKDTDNLENYLVNASGVVNGILSQRVRIYTTWDDDTAAATTLVPFVTAQQ